MVRIIAVGVGAMLIWWGSVSAQDRPKRSEGAFMVEGLNFEDGRFEDGLGFGGLYTYNLSERRYAFEMGLSIARTTFSGPFTNRATGASVVVADRDATVALYHWNVVYRFRAASTVTSFTTMGIGGMTTDVQGFDAESETAFNFGGGLKIHLNPDVLFRIEIRDFVSSVDIGGFLPTHGQIFVSPSGTQNVLEISAGVGITF